MVLAACGGPGLPATGSPTTAIAVSPAVTEAPPAAETPSPSAEPSDQPTALPPDLPTATATELPTETAGPEVALSGSLADIGYQVPLTVRHLTPTTASFSFELDQPTAGYLLYRPDLPSVQGWYTVELDPNATQQQFRLEDLVSGQDYLVQLGLGSDRSSLQPVGLQGRRWGPLRIRTPELDASQLRIGVIGDSGFGDPTTAELVSAMAGKQLDFVLHTGDLVYNADEQDDPAQAWALKFYWQFAPLLAQGPVYTVPGNHEYDRAERWEGGPFYSWAFPAIDDPGLDQSAGFPWYAFSYGDIQFLMLDSQVFHGVAGRTEQTDWLRQRLADPEYRYSIAVFHTPPFNSGRHGADGLALMAQWTPLLESSNVPLVLSGHDHNYQRIEHNGVTYLVSGGGSEVLYAQSDPIAGGQAFSRHSHYVVLNLFQQSIEITAIGAGGSVLDRASISLP